MRCEDTSCEVCWEQRRERRYVASVLALGAAFVLLAWATSARGEGYASGFAFSSLSSPAAVSSAGPTLGQIPIAPDYLCGVGVVTGADAWECRTKGGGSIAVTQGVGAAYATVFGRRTLADVTVSSAPRLADGTRDSLRDVWTGDHTLVVIAAATATDTAFPILFSHALSNAGMYAQTDSAGGFSCTWGTGSGATSRGVTAGHPGRGWIVAACRMQGTQTTARVNGASNTGTRLAAPVAPTAGTDVWFGRNTGGLAMRGPFGATLLYRRALTDDELSRIEAGWFGAMVGDRPITTTRASKAECQADDGSWYTVGDNAPCVNSKGIFVGRKTENYWTSSTTPSLWGVNNGTVTWQDVGGGWWRATDTDAAALPSRTGGRNGAVDGVYTAQCRVRAGSVSTARLRWFASSGTAPAQCANVVITSDTAGQVITCTGTLTGASGSGNIVSILEWGVEQPGSATGGTFDIQHCQLEFSPTPGRRVDCGAAAPCTVEAERATLATDGFPVRAGELELRFESRTSTASSVVLADTRPAANGPGWILETSSSALIANAYDGTTFHQAPVTMSWASRPFYAVMAWREGWLGSYIDGALVSTRTPASVPSIGSQMFLGSRRDASAAFFADGWLWPRYIGPPRARTGEGQTYFEADLWHSGEPKACTAADQCVLDCWANASGSMDCRDGNGATVAVTPGVGATVEATPFRPADGTVRRAVGRISDTSAPFIPAETMDSLGFNINANHTAIAVGYTTAIHATEPMLLTWGPGSVSGFYMRASSGTMLNVNYGGSGTGAQANIGVTGQTLRDAWNIMASRKAGGFLTARVNGTTNTSDRSGYTLASPVGKPLYFGRYDSAGYATGGPLAHVRIYSRALSDAELDEYEARMWGTWASKPGTPIKVSRSTPVPCQQSDGSWHTLGPNAPCVNQAKGLEVRASATSYTANDNVPTALFNGTAAPTVNADGSLAFVDDSTSSQGAGFGNANGLAGETWTATCEANWKSGDSPFLRVTLNGTSSGMVCTLPATPGWRKYDCTITLSVDSPIRASIIYGNSSGAMGTWDTMWCQASKTNAPIARVGCTTAPCTRAADVATVATTGWPVERGFVEALITPANANPVGGWWLDSRTGTSGDGFGLYNGGGGLTFFTRNTSGLGTLSPVGITWPQSTRKARGFWGGTTVGLAIDGVTYTNNTSIPAALAPAACIGSGFYPTCNSQVEGWIRELRLGAY